MKKEETETDQAINSGGKQKDLIKHMTPEHPDYDNLNRALDKVLDVADYLDHERAKAESVNKVKTPSHTQPLFLLQHFFILLFFI